MKCEHPKCDGSGTVAIQTPFGLMFDKCWCQYEAEQATMRRLSEVPGAKPVYTHLAHDTEFWRKAKEACR